MRTWYIEFKLGGNNDGTGKAFVKAHTAVGAITALQQSKKAWGFDSKHVTLVAESQGIQIIQQSSDIPF